jgi:asparagine synthase (glutamine-hydrolysing)
VSQLASDDVKVALSGEGGDELFGGYYTYAADLIAERVGGLAGLARPLVERLPTSTARASFDYKAKRFVRAAHLPPLERHHGWKEIFSPELRAELRGTPSAFDPVDLYRARYAETAGAPELARLQDVDFGIYLVDDLLVKTDRASMASSLEARVPFLDSVITNFAFTLPTRHKVRGLSKKVLLRKAAAPLLPREIVHGRKRGFSIPAAAWLRGELEPFARATLSAETLRRQGFFEPVVVTRLIDEHVQGVEDRSRQLWGLLAFTLWHERHVEQPPPLLTSGRMEALVSA